MKLPRVRTQYDTDYKAEVFFTDPGDGPSLTQQSMMEETDINTIMKRYETTRDLTHLGQIAGIYGDFSDVDDYKTGMDRINNADALFMELPAQVRDRFGNDPAAFVDFATNPENIGEMRKMGLAPPPPPDPVVPITRKDLEEVMQPVKVASKNPATGETS